MNTMNVTLSDGTKVEVREVWNCCEGGIECGSALEVRNIETGEFLAEISGMSLPDTDDEDYNENLFIQRIEEYIQ